MSYCLHIDMVIHFSIKHVHKSAFPFGYFSFINVFNFDSIRREQVQYFGVGLDELSKKTAITQLNGSSNIYTRI